MNNKTLFIAIILLVVIVAGAYFLLNNNKQQDGGVTLIDYLRANFGQNIFRNRVVSRYETPTTTNQTVAPLVSLSSKDIEFLKEIEKRVCNSNNIDWNNNTTIEITDVRTNTYPNLMLKLIGLFILLLNNREFNALSQEDKEYLTILSLNYIKIASNSSEEEFKNIIKYNDANKTIEIVYAPFTKVFNELYIQMSSSFTPDEKLPENNILSLDTFIKYMVLGMTRSSTDPQLANSMNYILNNTCTA